MLRSQGVHQGVTTQRRQRKEHRCEKIDPITGQRCTRIFGRAWNLKRHERDMHRKRSTVFINYTPTTAQSNMTGSSITGIQLLGASTLDLPIATASAQEPEAARSPAQATRTRWPQAHTIPSPASSSASTIFPVSPALATSRPPPIPATSSLKAFESSSWTPKTPVQEASGPAVDRATSIRTPSALRTPSSPPQSTEHVYSAGEPEDQSSQSDPGEDEISSFQSEQDLDSDKATSDTEESRSELRTSNEDPDRASRKRRRSGDRGRIIDADRKIAVPTYLVKRSKKTRGQQRGLDWLTTAGKAHCDATMETLLAQWGVKAEHRGTCVLLPEDWKALDPVELMTIFDDHQLPSGGASRAWYSYSDHATSLARAAAWYGHWPRTGVELDNFLGCGPFKPMDGSHLCHHEHCIVHLTYESAAINWDRWGCCLEARFLRQDDREVPEHCTKHSSPCLMQVNYSKEFYHRFADLSKACRINNT